MRQSITENTRRGHRAWVERRRRDIAKRDEAIVLMWKSGARGKAIAAQFGISYSRFRTIISEAGATRWRRC